MKKILCIEDNPEVQILVEASLPHQQVTFAPSLSDARVSLQSQKFDLIILDVELPDGDGLKFLTQIQASHSVPVFVLTGKSEAANQVIAFSLGADDFIAKPFDPLVLRARIEAKLRKVGETQDTKSVIRIKDLSIDIPKQRVHFIDGGKQLPIDLTSIEFKLLITFARAPDHVFSRNRLLDEVWGSQVSITDRTVDTHVGHLRKKISRSTVKIETVINEGYRLLP